MLDHCMRKTHSGLENQEEYMLNKIQVKSGFLLLIALNYCSVQPAQVVNLYNG